MAFLDSVDKKYHAWIYGAGFVLLLAIVFYLISGSGVSNTKTISFPAVVLTKSENCGYCIKFKDTWKKLSSSGLKTASGIPLKFIDVDSTNTELLAKFPAVEGYPTIRYHYSFTNFVEYSGDRSYEDLVSFIKSSETDKEGYAQIKSAPAPSGTGADPSTGSARIARAPDGKTKGMLPATVPGAPATGASLTPNKASFNMLSDVVYTAPPSLVPIPAHRKDCKKETKCDYVDYTKKPSSLGSGIDPKNELFVTGSILRTNLTDRAYPQARKGGIYLQEQW